MPLKTVLLLCGGRSEEHEISLISAVCILEALDRTRFRPVVVTIDKKGAWRMARDERFYEGEPRADRISVRQDADLVRLWPYAQDGVGRLETDAGTVSFDIVFPILHGPYGEDGRMQGMLEVLGVPFVGSGCGSSWNCMDKAMTKQVAASFGVPVVESVLVTPGTVKARRAEILRLGFPMFVKPTRQGSSVGVSKVTQESDLDGALAKAFQHDNKVLVERGVAAREIECAVLGLSGNTKVAPPGEIVVSKKAGWYSYEAKYLIPDAAETLAPAPLTPEQRAEAERIALLSFEALECDGLARVDLFLEKETGSFYLNEINTMPGFTPISMYPKMWQTAGVAYSALVTELLDLAERRHRATTV